MAASGWARACRSCSRSPCSLLPARAPGIHPWLAGCTVQSREGIPCAGHQRSPAGAQQAAAGQGAASAARSSRQHIPPASRAHSRRRRPLPSRARRQATRLRHAPDARHVAERVDDAPHVLQVLRQVGRQAGGARLDGALHARHHVRAALLIQRRLALVQLCIGAHKVVPRGREVGHAAIPRPCGAGRHNPGRQAREAAAGGGQRGRAPTPARPLRERPVQQWRTAGCHHLGFHSPGQKSLR